eukprot:CAMPEP_0197653660 /NCGR_PEP_ID=MMETSP1338-20131121/36599_1 /TAXON_ID=43686 ORGANISM="Pelagodinium beii, Strain RCC1491" /NCGR_SAMPLE_ID=MMETSP1338 /ASSEMBLY_ACC=CAM_ASM_000754 /LENGTH=94 /DNA_ID=CAMNT_0043228859 /DNA_START=141 /DNA_END=425 /DNA_ORIENTATION=-
MCFTLGMSNEVLRSVARRGLMDSRPSTHAEKADVRSRVEDLRKTSLQACMEVQEGDVVAAEECAILSYELATAETLLAMRTDRDHHEWTDSDSY